MLKGNFFYFLLFLAFSCKYEPSTVSKVHTAKIKEGTNHNNSINNPVQKDSVTLGPGVLYYKGRQIINSETSPIVTVRNVNGEIYKEVNVLNDTVDFDDFFPFMIYLEYDILVFEVKKIVANNYWVYINKDVKKIDLNENKILEFLTWKDYFLHTDIALELDNSNKFYNNYGAKKRKINKKIDFEEDEFTILEINDYWMKIRITHFGEDEELDESFEAWTKWRNQSDLLVGIGIGR